MSTLHILYSAQWPMALERLWSAGDSLLLAGASVSLALSPSSPLVQFLQRENATPSISALADAVHCRGLQAHWPETIALISPSQWVAAVSSHSKSLSWT